MKSINKSNEVNNILSIKKNDNIVLIDKNNRYDILSSYYFNDYINQKKLKRFIKHIESRFRSSLEYKKYLGFLINDQNIKSCSIFGNIDEESATLEFHHYPFTLYDIVEIIINKYIMTNTKFNSFIILQELINIHYNNEVGLVRLCKTAHELVHDGSIFISIDSVFGKVNEFINNYYNYIPEDLIKKYNDIIEMDKKGKDDKKILRIEKSVD